LRLGLCLVPLHPDQDALVVDELLQGLQPRFAILGNDLSIQCQRHVLFEYTFLLHPERENWLQWQAGRADVSDVSVSKADNHLRNVSLLFHSSGTEGSPKAIYYSQQQLTVFLYWQQHLFAAFPDDPELPASSRPSPRISSLPLTHWGGLSFCLQAHLDGRCVYLCSGATAKDQLVLADEIGCQLLFFVPAMYRDLLDALRYGICPWSLQYCLTMGEAMAVELSRELRMLTCLEFYTAYGMSEALCGLAHHGDEPWETIPEGSCGRHLFGEIQLVDEAGNIASEQGEAEGELWVRNATTAPCYRDTALLAAKYVDGWYRSGDLFRRDAAGHYFFVGRVDNMCVHNGRNVYPQQIEAVFIRHEAVMDCIAAPIVTREGSRRLALLVVQVPGSTVRPEQLMDFYLQHGALYAAPVFLHNCISMPLTTSGKPDRKAVTDLLQDAYGQST
jgi:acyl-CoA synthetase (AMP-forming)/AMP-acid ligase II